MWLASMGFLWGNFLSFITSTVGKVIIIGLICLGSMFYFHKKVMDEAEKKIKDYVIELQQKDAALKEIEKKISDGTVTQYVDNIDTIEKQKQNYREASKNVPNRKTTTKQNSSTVGSDSAGPSNGWVLLHDSSATGKDADPARVADASPSRVEDNQIIGVVSENYAICRENSEQLISLQNWIRENLEAINRKTE